MKIYFGRIFFFENFPAVKSLLVDFFSCQEIFCWNLFGKTFFTWIFLCKNPFLSKFSLVEICFVHNFWVEIVFFSKNLLVEISFKLITYFWSKIFFFYFLDETFYWSIKVFSWKCFLHEYLFDRKVFPANVLKNIFPIMFLFKTFLVEKFF